MIFKGIITALITPFKNDKIDLGSLEKLIDKQVAAGVDGVVIGGSTGEGSSLSEDEQHELLAAALKFAVRRVKIIAAITAVSTTEAVKKVQDLCKFDIDGIMCTAPHYVRPEQQGLILHYEAISKASSVPLMVYIHPGRTGCDFSDKTLLEIASFKNIEAVKDATSDIEKPLRILPKVKNFNMMIGDDSRMLAYNAHGGAGCVSVTANIFPKILKKIDILWRQGKIVEARDLQQKLMPFFASISAESNPIGIKYAVFKAGLCGSEIRLPLTVAKPDTHAAIAKALEELLTVENNV
jgi:4-hydroxy-tetrahydrodipicolinate synthase